MRKLNAGKADRESDVEGDDDGDETVADNVFIPVQQDVPLAAIVVGRSIDLRSSMYGIVARDGFPVSEEGTQLPSQRCTWLLLTTQDTTTSSYRTGLHGLRSASCCLVQPCR